MAPGIGAFTSVPHKNLSVLTLCGGIRDVAAVSTDGGRIFSSFGARRNARACAGGIDSE